MITLGIILIALALILPAIGVAGAGALLHAALVIGIILLIVGLILFLLGRSGRHVGGRAHYW